VVKVEGLGKQYHIGGPQERYKTMRDTLTNAALYPMRVMQSLSGSRHSNGNGRNSESFWALKDVSFEIGRGEVVGVIGRNGAGKSTLLKVLSRITEPTTGYIDVYGNVGSLLEVGTGFHPELTGRENIYLNGAILGMPRTEVERNFDEIVEFAEVQRFLDTPVKRYSSGMYMRLAFAVAVHMKPEVLVIDEVLAVGDAEFQKKCFNKMQEVSRGGRTILFVSHNMAAIRSICNRGLIMQSGRLIEQGDINSVVDTYLAQTNQQQVQQINCETNSFKVDEVQIYATYGSVIKTFDSVEIRVKFTAKMDILDPGLYVGILTFDYQRVAGLDFKDFSSVSSIKAGEQAELGFSIAELPLLPGTYQLEVYLKDMASLAIELIPTTFPFDIVETPVYGSRKLESWNGYVGLKVYPYVLSNKPVGSVTAQETLRGKGETTK